MRCFLLGAAATFLGLCHSFLIPAEITAIQAEIFERLSIGYIAPVDKQAIRIQCPGCPVGTNSTARKSGLQTDDSLLELNFTIQHNNVDQLLLNDVPIYPIDYNLQYSPKPLSAPQMIKNKDGEWEYISTVGLAFSTRTQQFAKNMAHEDIDLITIKIDILQVNDAFPSGIPTVELELLKTAAGKLHVRKTEIRKSETSILDVIKFEDCSTLLCRLRVMLSEALRKAKGVTKPCGSRHGPAPLHQSEGPQQSQPKLPTPPKEIPRPFPHDLRLKSILGSIFYRTLSLVLLGILLSISACLLGALVGHILICLWTRMFRHNSVEYTSVPQSDMMMMMMDEKVDIYKDLHPTEESLPVYRMSEETESQ